MPMKFAVSPIWSYPVVALVIIGLLALVVVTYPRRIRHLGPWTRRVLITLRVMTVLLLAWGMLRPELQFSKTDSNSGAIYVLSDASRSMTTEDGPGGLTRRQILLKTLEECQEQFAALGENVDVIYADFAEDVAPVENLEDDAQGNQTAIGNVLETLSRESRNRRVLGAVLLSDGAQRAVAPFDADPRAQARQLARQQVPVYTVPIGGSGVTGSAFDLAIEDLIVDPVSFEKKNVPVTARLRVLGAAGRDITVQLLAEQRLGKQPGEAGEMEIPPATRNARPVVRVKPETNDEVIPIELSFVPELPGEFKLAVYAVPLDGEVKQANNIQETIITVQKGGINVAYFDRIRNENKSVRIVRRDEKVQLDVQEVRQGEFQHLTRIDESMFDPGRYDVYIIGDVPAEVFGPAVLRKLAERVDQGAGLMMLGGYHSFGPGGYADTPLAELLPVRMNRADVQTGDEIDTSLHFLESLKMLPTRRGEQQYVMRLAPPGENRSRWEELYPLEGANKLQPAYDGVEILAETPDGIPLLFAHEVGRARVLAFAADTTYLWFMHGHHPEHERFWRQVVLWLARKEMQGDQPIWVRVDPRNFAPGQDVELMFGAQTEEGEPIEDVTFAVEVTTPDERELGVSPRSNGTSSSALFAETDRPGDYWVRVTAEKDGESLGFPAFTRFIVDARDLELDNPAADDALLAEISATTGGLSLPPEELPSFLNRSLSEGLFRNTELTQVTRITLWDNWAFLLAFVGLMSSEWALRKWRGLV